MSETRKSSLLGKFTVLVVICCCSLSAQAKYGGGSGTLEAPYLIYDANQMNAIGADSNDWDKHFKLMADIDLSGLTGTSFNIIGYYRPYLVYDPFTGVFDGNGHTIVNFTYDSNDWYPTGLFGYVDAPNAEIRNLGLIDPNVYTGTGNQAASLVGYLKNGTITECYVEGGSISGNSAVGGLVGGNGGTITNCYSTGSVTGMGVYVGGLVGGNSGTITNCYSTGIVLGNSSVGGLVGGNGGKVSISFWDIETSGQSTSDGGTGKTTAEMQTAITFARWKCNPVWTIDEGNDYPRLWWEDMPGETIPAYSYGGGSGGANDPYLIYTTEQLNTIGLVDCDWDKHFKLMADIDLSVFTGTSYNIIGYFVDWDSPDNKPFTGVFDGNGHTISNFNYTSTNKNRIGLFRHVTGEIKNLGLIDPNVDAGTGSQVGSLVGYLSEGTIANCYAEGGSISGDASIGGLAGINRGTISNCYSTCSISGSSSVGGLVGVYNIGTINNCYSTGDVSGSSRVGGLVGGGGHSFQGKIINCYSTGSVSGDSFTGGLVGMTGFGIEESFWDIETSGQVSSSGGTGLPTAQMQDPNTFMDAGWDLVGEPDGPSDIWAEPSGGGYPILWWQLSPLPTLPAFSGGTGEPNKPYLISTATELNSIGHNPRLMRDHFQLINDIDLTGVNFFIIGSEPFPFSGVFDGNDHTISNFTYDSNDRDCIGLFGYVSGDNAVIKDLDLIDPNLDAGTGWFVGSLVGNLVEGTITNCYTEGGSISGQWYVGGLVGENFLGTINNCYSTGSITGDFRVGGLVGTNSDTISNSYSTASVSGGSTVGGLVGFNVGIVSNCFTSGNVTGNAYVGGLVAENRGIINNCYSKVTVSGGGGGLVGSNVGTVSDCYSTGSISGDNYVGGLVGNNGGTITNCYSTATVSGDRGVGGLVGSNSKTITNCYATGSVSGGDYVGGLVGSNSRGTITNCYSTGGVAGTNIFGGLVGWNYEGTVTTSFWNIETSGQVSSAGGTGLPTADMQMQITFTDAGWDFITPIWKMNCEGMSYPKLSSWKPILGDFLCPDGVDFIDYSFFTSHWQEDNCGASNDCDGRDFDLLGSVDIKDLRIFADNWLRGF